MNFETRRIADRDEYLSLRVDVQLYFPCRLKTQRNGEPRKDEALKM